MSMLFHGAADNNCFTQHNSAVFVPARDTSRLKHLIKSDMTK